MSNTIQTPKAPSSPFATIKYEQIYADQLNNVLRLYFNQIDNAFSALLSTAGGALLRFPNGSFYLADAIGKAVFLTMEEAENRLKGE